MTESENENDHFDLDHFDRPPNIILNAAVNDFRLIKQIECLGRKSKK